MLKVVVFDGGFGGELFADKLEAELPILEVIRVIDWRKAKDILESPRKARRAAEIALRPYLGKVDLIFFANFLLSTTSLRYFRRKYKNQKFLGLELRSKRLVKKPTLILTTKAVTRSIHYYHFSHQLHAKTICLDRWPELIDNGEFTHYSLKQDLETATLKIRFSPQQILLACGQFTELKPHFRQIFGHNIRIVDNFDSAIRATKKALRIKGE